MDYWGVSYKQALEYVLNIDKRDTLYIRAQNYPCEGNAFLLPKNDRKRIIFVHKDSTSADYFITNYRFHPGAFEKEKFTEIKSFTVLDNKIISIFKVKNRDLHRLL